MTIFKTVNVTFVRLSSGVDYYNIKLNINAPSLSWWPFSPNPLALQESKTKKKSYILFYFYRSKKYIFFSLLFTPRKTTSIIICDVI